MFGNSKKMLNEIKIEITELKKQKVDIIELQEHIGRLQNEIDFLKKENIYCKNMLELNKFYSDVIIRLNDKSNYLTLLQDIKEFYNNNNLKSKKISSKDINNYHKGKKGELFLLNKFKNYKKTKRKIEYFYDFNIQDGDKNIQFDFLAVTRNNIYIVEVKTLEAESMDIAIDNNGRYYLRAYYKSKKSYDMKLDSIRYRNQLIQKILNKFYKKYEGSNFNVFNIIIFVNDLNVMIDKGYNDVENKGDCIALPINDENNRKIQILIGEEQIENYFEKYLSKVKEGEEDLSKYNKEDDIMLDEFTKFIKSDITFRESTDKNYITQSIIDFFKEVFIHIEY